MLGLESCQAQVNVLVKNPKFIRTTIFRIKYTPYVIRHHLYTPSVPFYLAYYIILILISIHFIDQME